MKLVDGDRLGLANTMGSVNGLFLDGRVEVWLEHDNMVGTGQVQTGGPRSQADQQHLDVRVCLHIEAHHRSMARNVK